MTNPTIVIPEPRKIVIEDREQPEPDSGAVLIETDTSLISAGTELTILSGEYPDNSIWDEYGTYPFVPGYANVGTVVESKSSIETGTRVATWSPHAAFVTAPADECVIVPKAVTDEQASLFAIAQIVMNGVRRGRTDWGETAVVYGLGILGQLAVRFCHLLGVETVIGVDLVEQRIEYLPDEEGIVGIDATAEDPEEIIEAVTDGRLADVVFEVTGNPDAIPSEFDILRDQGRLVLLSSPHGTTELDFHDYVNAPSIEIIGAHQTSHPAVATAENPWTKPHHAELFFSYLQQGRLAVDDLFSNVCSYEQAPDIYTSLLENRTEMMAVRMQW